MEFFFIADVEEEKLDGKYFLEPEQQEEMKCEVVINVNHYKGW